tara:strand:+ start:238 stop:2622 length:2385 start_codon:yes stop_codon:yes gene_type:complete
MNNFSNRRMFMSPVMAAEGIYMPTIEQILNFYMGEFTDDGRPTDMEAFQEAIDTARKADEAGLFPEEGKPIDNYLYFGKDVKDFAEKEGVNVQEPVYGQYPSGAQLGELDKESSFLTDLYSIPARKEYADSRVESDKVKAEADAQKESFLNAMEATKDFEFPKPEQVDVEQGFVEEKKIEDNPYLKELEKFQKTSAANVDMPMVDQRKAYQSGQAGIPEVKLDDNQVAAINARNYMRELSDQFPDMKPEDVETMLRNAVTENKGLSSIINVGDNITGRDEVKGAGVTSTPGYENFVNDMLNEYYQKNPEARPKTITDNAGFFNYLPFSSGPFDFNFKPEDEQYINKIKERGGVEGTFEITDDGRIARKTGIETVADDVEGDVKRGDLEYQIKESEQANVAKAIKDKQDAEPGFFEKEEVIEKYDKDGDGELSFLEKAEVVAGKLTGTDVSVKKETPSEIDSIVAGTSEAGDKKVDLAGRADNVGMSEEEVKDDEKKLNDADLKDGADTKDDDENKLSTAGESSTSSTEDNEMSAFDSEIAKVAKEAGFSWSDMTGDGSSKDNDALEMMMYGLKLATTPGSFNDAVMQNAKEYLNNKIKRNYKTAAAKADLKKQIFLKYLQGNIDLKKWNAEQDYKAKNKSYNESKFYSNDEMNGMIADWAMGNFKLNLQGAEPGTAEYGLSLAMKDEITKIASEYKKDGLPPPRNITQMAYDRIDDNFNITKGKEGTYFAIPFFGNFFDKPGTVERTQSSSGNLVVTVSDFEQIKEKYKGNAELTDEVLIAALKDQGYDTSLIE